MTNLTGNSKNNLHELLFSDLNKVFLFRTILSFAQSMIFVFVPTFLYKQGISLVNILLYAITIYSFVIILNPLTLKIMNKIGYKFSLTLSVPFSFLHFYLINLVSENISFLFLGGLCQGIHLSLFFMALDSEYALQGNSKKRASQMGTINIFLTLATTFAPFIGGFLLDNSTYFTLIMAVIGVGVFSVLPLLLTKEPKMKPLDFKYKDYNKFIKKADPRAGLFYLSQGAEIMLSLFIWPIALYLILDQSFSNLGLVLTISSFVSVLILFFIKKIIDEKPKHFFLKINSQIKKIEYLLKFISYFLAGILIYFVETISKLNDKVFNLTHKAIFLNNATKTNFFDYYLMCDFYRRIGRIVMGLLLMAIFLIFGESEIVLFSVLLSGVLISFGFETFKEIKSSL
jgi:hypothetical protein